MQVRHVPPVLRAVTDLTDFLSGRHAPQRPVEVISGEVTVDRAERHPVEVAFDDGDPTPVARAIVVPDVPHSATEDSVHRGARVPSAVITEVIPS